jgi:hypothetical protein
MEHPYLVGNLLASSAVSAAFLFFVRYVSRKRPNLATLAVMALTCLIIAVSVQTSTKNDSLEAAVIAANEINSKQVSSLVSPRSAADDSATAKPVATRLIGGNEDRFRSGDLLAKSIVDLASLSAFLDEGTCRNVRDIVSGRSRNDGCVRGVDLLLLAAAV